jgi:hypothetical protein
MNRRKQYKGVPPNLIPLAQKGLRIRYNGFWLNASQHDRAIAQWIDETPSAGTIIKELIFNYLRGSDAAQIEIPSENRREDSDIANTLGHWND